MAAAIPDRPVQRGDPRGDGRGGVLSVRVEDVGSNIKTIPPVTVPCKYGYCVRPYTQHLTLVARPGIKRELSAVPGTPPSAITTAQAVLPRQNDFPLAIPRSQLVLGWNAPADAPTFYPGSIAFLARAFGRGYVHVVSSCKSWLR
ncbi:uncharacterized protein THITE_2121789 [Thermothielavioides terrestris NRRL 8126]|uniref:Uncharacterized protein n=1 Tax=Thermothielavioides terrestris (strain ATCC 38088 / NRRL 8126) TaxID=578455 RepID=G2RFB0_THETT|nr:uncharacterized protein THITE_2121789 [Thermothielavioides terrestris NRRL 8126]AEO70393.1 hypothetical protein THITE_2121789 [Thermothielavioides terrestris NRRL 8126]